MLRSFSLLQERAVVFGARALWGFGLDVEHNGDLPRERECPDRDADRKGDLRCAAEEGVPAVEAERDRADRGYDADVDGVFGRRDGGGLRRLASGHARRLRERVAVKGTNFLWPLEVGIWTQTIHNFLWPLELGIWTQTIHNFLWPL